MDWVKSLAVVLLSVFLIVTGFVGLTGVAVPVVVKHLVDLAAVGAGVLFLVHRFK